METNNLLLFEDMVILSDLSYETACRVLDAAEGSPALQHVTLTIVSHGARNKWNIHATCRHLRELFLKNPGQFVIELDSGLVKQINKEQENDKCQPDE